MGTVWAFLGAEAKVQFCTVKERNCPPDIKTSDLITDISFHPESDCIAVGGITGDLSIFKYSNEENKPRWMDVEVGEDVEGEVVVMEEEKQPFKQVLHVFFFFLQQCILHGMMFDPKDLQINLH